MDSAAGCLACFRKLGGWQVAVFFDVVHDQHWRCKRHSSARAREDHLFDEEAEVAWRSWILTAHVVWSATTNCWPVCGRCVVRLTARSSSITAGGGRAAVPEKAAARCPCFS